MSEAFNPAEFAAQLIAAFADRLFDAAKSATNELHNNVKMILKTAFTEYIETASRRCGSVKTLVSGNTPRYLYDFYTPIDLKRDGIVLTSPTIRDLFSHSNRVIIAGTGGCGKSTLMRHFFLDAVKTHYKIPIFVELRALNDTPDSLIHFIVQSLKLHSVDLPDQFIYKALERGYFVLLLDGLDELNKERTKNIHKEINDISVKYKNIDVVITSRPSDEFYSWGQFYCYAPVPLTLSKACDLIRKLNYDAALATRFNNALINGLYEQYKSFLSNPLLLTIMLLTFRDRAGIPTKLHLFYAQAFEALYNRHDAAKEGQFQRQLETGLAIDDFKRMCASFAILTYTISKPSFTLEEARRYVVNAAKVAGFDVTPEAFLSDMTKAVCVLVQDGGTIGFTHRSFQEYFAAVYIHDADRPIQKELIDRILTRVRQDNVLNLLYEMDRDFVESKIIIPFLDDLHAHLKWRGKMSKAVYKRFHGFAPWELGMRERNGERALVMTRMNSDTLGRWSLIEYITAINGFVIYNDDAVKRLRAKVDELIPKGSRSRISFDQVSSSEEMMSAMDDGVFYVSSRRCVMQLMRYREELKRSHDKMRTTIQGLLLGGHQ